MAHANAKLNLYGRRLVVSRVEEGWTYAQVATASGVSRSTVEKWWKRYREEGDAGLEERSSRAKRLQHALSEHIIEAICRLRRELGAGPHRIAWELGMQASTVYGVLKRAGLSVLARLDRRTRAIVRYERERPGELVHFDIKKLGKVPDGGGKRFDAAGRRQAQAGARADTTTSTSPSTTTVVMRMPKRSLTKQVRPPRAFSPGRSSPSGKLASR